MASINTEGGDGLNVELNLVPFIDLLSTLVLFLLVTAVWMQVSSISTSTEARGRSVASPVENKRLMVNVTSGGYQLSLNGRSQFVARGNDNSALVGAARRFMVGAKSPAAGVTAEGAVEYGTVVKAIDALKEAGYGSVALSAN